MWERIRYLVSGGPAYDMGEASDIEGVRLLFFTGCKQDHSDDESHLRRQ